MCSVTPAFFASHRTHSESLPRISQMRGALFYNGHMEPQIIESMVARLPVSEMTEANGAPRLAEDHEIWEIDDGGAKVKVTRHEIPLPDSNGVLEVIALSVSGAPNERRRVISEFAEVFGSSADSDTSPETASYIDTVLWIVNT